MMSKKTKSKTPQKQHKQQAAMGVMSDWKLKKLEEIALIERGRFSTRPRNDPQYYGGNIPFIQTGDVANANGSVTSYSQTLNDKGLTVSKMFSKNSLVISIAANIGDVARVSFDFACPDSLAVIQPYENTDATWLKYLLESKKPYFESRATQNAQANINLQTIKPFKVYVPSYEEQKAIASLLATWDTAIEKTEALIAAKERQFDWLRSSLICNTKNTVPSHFGDFLSESRIIDKNNDAQRRITVRLHLKGVEVREYRGTEAEGATQYFVRKAGQLIYGKQNIFRGSIGIVPEELDGYCSSQDIPAFDITRNICPDWLFWYMSRPYFYKKLEHFSAGSGSKRLHPKELFRMAIPLPSFPEQKYIAETLNTAKKEITLLKNLTEKYRTQKRALMQKLLTGAWRVKV